MLLSFACFAFSFFFGAGEDTIKDFKKYYPSFTSSPQKVEAILSLEGIDIPDRVECLLPLFSDPDPEVRNALLRILGEVKDPASVAVMVQSLKGKTNPAKIGAVEALGKGKHAQALGALMTLSTDTNTALRVALVGALGEIGDRSANEIVWKYMEEGKEELRVAACDAAGMLADPVSVDRVIARLADKEWRVRAAAIGALSQIRATPAVPALIQSMEKEEGRLVEDAGRALEKLTGLNLGLDLVQWKDWWNLNGKNYRVPTAAELAAWKEKERKSNEKYGMRGDVVNYNGITTLSKRILFVIDQSGSMEEEVTDRARFQDRGYPSFSKFEIVKQELIRTIRNLDSKVQFNIITFASDVFIWKKQLASANLLNKTSAEGYIKSLLPIGGHSKEGLAAAGLMGSAGLELGRTNSHLALMTALGGPGGKQIGDVPEEVDTIFFLSDGRPSTGIIVEPADLSRAVRQANEAKKVVIHALAIGEFQRDFMQNLAKENGGVFVDLGK